MFLIQMAHRYLGQMILRWLLDGDELMAALMHSFDEIEDQDTDKQEDKGEEKH